ncbi:MAG TPA: hypothetical protein VJC12_03310 [Candidatus Paceibacterota bacterium]
MANGKKDFTLSWQSLEYDHYERSNDWFWAVGIIAVSVAITAIIFKDILFAIIIIVGAFTLMLYATRAPHEIEISITDKGIKLDKIFYPYHSLESFWVEELDHRARILIKSQRLIMPYIIAPINRDEIDPEQVRKTLTRYLPQVFHSESIFHHWMEYLGF